MMSDFTSQGNKGREVRIDAFAPRAPGGSGRMHRALPLIQKHTLFSN
jgi:hypothetical protein